MSKIIDIGDKSAVVLSLVCTLHCIGTPLLLVMVPSISGVLAFDPEALHLWLLYAVIPISLFAMIAGYFHHHRTSISLISLLGMLLLIGAVIFGHDIMNGLGEVILTVLGSILIAVGHIKNLMIRRAYSQLGTLNT
jgi:hypothetical protein